MSSVEHSDRFASPTWINCPISIPPITPSLVYSIWAPLSDSPGVHICSASLSNLSLWQLERSSLSSPVKCFISLFFLFKCEPLLSRPAFGSLGQAATSHEPASTVSLPEEARWAALWPRPCQIQAGVAYGLGVWQLCFPDGHVRDMVMEGRCEPSRKHKVGRRNLWFYKEVCPSLCLISLEK